MDSTTVVFVVIAVIFAFWFFNKKDKSQNKQSSKKVDVPDSPIKPSYLMSEHEKLMFRELSYLPDCYIFPQVALGAILWTSTWQTRNKFNKKIADFVVTDHNFNILAVIELDDKSHDNKVEADNARDAMVREAGYRVLRYRTVPNRDQLAEDILN